MKNAFIFSFLLILLTLASSCKQEDCANCNAVVEQKVDGKVVSSSTIADTEICGAQLEDLKKNPVQTINTSTGSITMVTTTTYTCN